MLLRYSLASPYARRVRIVLAELDLSVESDLQDRLRPVDEIAEHSPALQVPVLHDGERTLFGSLLIQDYLLTNYAGARSPGSALALSSCSVRPEHHWDDRQVLTAIETATDAYITIRMMGGDWSAAAFLSRLFERVHHILDWLEQRVTSSGFWPDALSVADINLVCLVDHAASRGFLDALDRWPKTAALSRFCAGRTSFSTTEYPPPA